jgi:hypothetical protein
MCETGIRHNLQNNFPVNIMLTEKEVCILNIVNSLPLNLYIPFSILSSHSQRTLVNTWYT